MTVAIKIQVPKNVRYKVRVRIERRSSYHQTWALAEIREFYSGDEATLWVCDIVRIAAIDEVPVDTVTPSPTDSHKTITINEDAHGG